jgi:hypothetical protein
MFTRVTSNLFQYYFNRFLVYQTFNHVRIWYIMIAGLIDATSIQLSGGSRRYRCSGMKSLTSL